MDMLMHTYELERNRSVDTIRVRRVGHPKNVQGNGSTAVTAEHTFQVTNTVYSSIIPEGTTIGQSVEWRHTVMGCEHYVSKITNGQQVQSTY